MQGDSLEGLQWGLFLSKTKKKKSKPEWAVWDQGGEGDSRDPATLYVIFCQCCSSNGEQSRRPQQTPSDGQTA